jgi:hypothetical protein
MYYFENYCTFDEDQRKVLDLTESPNFPYFWNKSTDNYKQFGHVLSYRHPSNTPVEGVSNSIYYEDFKKVFLDICNKNDIKVNAILRSSVNCTYHSSQKIGDIHTDHSFSHNIFIMYVNKFSNGNTYIFNEHDEIIKESIQDKDKFIVFSGEPHAQGFCAPGELRIVLAYTFI